MISRIDIQGYGGRYYVREDGTVWRHGKKKDWQLTGVRNGRNRDIKLTDLNGHTRCITMSKIMRLTWFRNLPEDVSLMHVNGLEEDWSIWNLKPVTKQQLGKLRNRSIYARTVIKRDPKTMEILTYYRSAREAGRKNFCSYQTILDACNRKNKKRTGICPDGYLYEWER